MFQVASTIESISTRKDHTLKISLSTQELNGEQKAELFNLHNKLGWFLFSESEMTMADIPEEQPEFNNRKSDSQRLRNVLYIYWNKLQEDGRTKKTFEQFKKEWYERKIEQIKQSINDV